MMLNACLQSYHQLESRRNTMSKSLLHIFIKDWQDASSPAVRAKIGRLSGIVGILCNVVLFAAKLIIGTISGSVAITADAMNNLSDASSSIVTLIGFKLAEKPADEDHPYGHARFEYLSGLAVAALIVVIGVELAKASVEKLFSPSPVLFSVPLLAVLLLSIGIKIWLCIFNRKLGNHIQSATLLATATDSRNDVISTAAVLFAALVEVLTNWKIDGIIGLGIALFILYSGAMLAKDIISPLLGEAASPELRQKIIDIVSSNPKVLAYHDLMVHDYGPGQRFASLHVEMDRKEDPMLCHDIIDELERMCLKQHNVHLVIHYDPVVADDEDLVYMRNVVTNILQQFDSHLSIHDFRMVQGNRHTNLIFDIALPYSFMERKKAIKAHLDAQLQAVEGGPYYTVITFDPTSFSQE